MKHARLGLVCALLLLAGCAQTTATQRKEQAIQAALDAAFLACQTALNSPDVTWAPGAREYCTRIVVAAPDCGLP